MFFESELPDQKLQCIRVNGFLGVEMAAGNMLMNETFDVCHLNFAFGLRLAG